MSGADGLRLIYMKSTLHRDSDNEKYLFKPWFKLKYNLDVKFNL